MSLTSTTVIQRAEGALSSRIEDATVLLRADDAVYFHMDAPATAIWELLEGEQTVGSLVAALVDRFDVDEATCRADVEAFLAQAKEAGLVRF
ncbi:MAG: PqqD family protein [Thermoplasmatota archaeon]